MKKYISLIFLTILTILTIGGCAIKFSQIDTEKYYVKIVENGKREELISFKNKKKLVDYYYRYENIPAYNKDGKKILVNINTLKDCELKKNSYLKVSVKDVMKDTSNEIQGFEEVKFSNIPSKAQQKLDK